MTPLVSIILPTYNWKPEWLSESIESVLNQTYTNFELIIINDASTNNIEETIFSYLKEDKRIIYIKNKRNLKLTKTLNKWIRLSHWKYIARIDDDDIWCDEKKLEKQVKFMEHNEEYGLCGTSTIIIDEYWKIIDKIKMREIDENIRNHFLQSNQFTHSAILLRKSILEKVWWKYNSKYNWAEDYELWLRVWRISRLYNLQNFCVQYRLNKKWISVLNFLKQTKLALKICKLNRDHYPNFYKALILRHIALILGKNITNFLLKIRDNYKKGVAKIGRKISR